MPRLTRTPPRYTLHKPSGQARVRVDGRDHYLGPYGSAESRRRYDELVARWLVGGPAAPEQARQVAELTVVELIARYWRFCRGHYLDDLGAVSREVRNIRDALRPVRTLYGATRAAEFGPAAMKAVRAEMVRAGLARTTINARVGKVRRLFKWAVENELVPADAYHRLCAVSPLRRGREGARETPPRRAVPLEHVEAALPHVRPPVAAMIRLQWLTGMRPGEAFAMTTGQIDRSGPVWVYRPIAHKTAIHGHAREVFLGPQAVAVVTPWLRADPDAPLFSPAEDDKLRQAERRAARATPMTPSQSARKPKRFRRRKPTDRYDRHAYNRAIARACDDAGVPRWSGNMLRHAAATRIRAEHGLEAAQVILGHSRVTTTQVYAVRNVELALRVVGAAG